MEGQSYGMRVVGVDNPENHFMPACLALRSADNARDAALILSIQYQREVGYWASEI